MPASPVRIAHLGDTHLGYHAPGRNTSDGRNQRMVDIELGFERAIDDLLTRDVDLVLHAGDVFHHTRPSWRTLAGFVRQMRRIEASRIPCVVIAGNHDTPRLRMTTSVYDLLRLALPDIEFVAGYEPQRVQPRGLDLFVHAIPHGAMTNPDPPMLIHEPGMLNVLLAHGVAPGLQLGGAYEPGEERLSAELLSPEMDYIALGHYHLHGNQGGNAWYSGSTERLGWGDEPATPGYNLVTLHGSGQPPLVEHVPVPARRMETLHRIDGQDLDARQLADVLLDRLRGMDDPEGLFRIPLAPPARAVLREAEGLVRREIGDAVMGWSLKLLGGPGVVEPGRDAGGLKPLRELFADFVALRAAEGHVDERFAAFMTEQGGQLLERAIEESERATLAEEGAA